MKKTIRSVLTMFLAAFTLLGGAGCANPIEARELTPPAAETNRDVSSLPQKPTDPFVAAMADFSMTLSRTTLALEREDKANHLISPLSAMVCLSMLANGACGETLAQMEAVLGMPVDELNESLYAYTKGLYVGEDCKVTLADSIWYRDEEGRLTVKDEFLQTCAEWYDAQQYAAPFDEQTRKDINAWAKKYTDGMIDTMLDDPIPAAAVMYLVNALVFDAKWQAEYEKTQIADRTFTAYDGTKTTVDMLHSEEGTYLEPADGQGFAKPYKGGKYSFVGLLSDEGVDVYDFAAALDGEAWTSMWQGRMTATVHVRIPEFSYDSFMTLTPVLKEMGITDLFDSELADLSGIGSSSQGNLFCSAVYQKTYIEVNRNGTKAAALTWGEVKDGAAADPAEAKYVFLERPFVYAIVDNATGLPLFVGVVTALSK